MLEDVDATADELRALAQQALDRGEAGEALIAAYRAVVASAIERTWLADRPGRTAHEAARELSTLVPTERQAVADAAAAFDAVRFGRAAASADQVRGVMELDSRLRSARPDQLAPLRRGDRDRPREGTLGAQRAPVVRRHRRDLDRARSARPEEHRQLSRPGRSRPERVAALVEVLRDHGVQVELVDTVAGLSAALAGSAGPAQTTVAIGDSRLLTARGAEAVTRAINGAGRLVLLDGAPAVLDVIDPDVQVFAAGGRGSDEFAAECSDSVVRDGATVGRFDLRLIADGGATSCFPLPGPPGSTTARCS